jgi:hypothetical protein
MQLSSSQQLNAYLHVTSMSQRSPHARGMCRRLDTQHQNTPRYNASAVSNACGQRRAQRRPVRHLRRVRTASCVCLIQRLHHPKTIVSQQTAMYHDLNLRRGEARVKAVRLCPQHVRRTWPSDKLLPPKVESVTMVSCTSLSLSAANALLYSKEQCDVLMPVHLMAIAAATGK